MEAPYRGLLIIEYLEHPPKTGDFENEKDSGREMLELELAARVPGGDEAGQELAEPGAVHERDLGKVDKPVLDARLEPGLDPLMERGLFYRRNQQLAPDIKDNDIAQLTRHNSHLVFPQKIDPDTSSDPVDPV